ncbi:MAG: FAD-dependent oxidoreductase, partial [Pelagibacterales bacterium]|nr:FAD-dependent oxidoreductase [Pelagibacterales bacterium]
KWDRIRPLVKWAEYNFPSINTEDIKPWAGLRPMTPNMMPIVRKSKYLNNVFYNTGHGHLGWTLSAATAKAISDMIN